jgi:hypothetical protein
MHKKSQVKKIFWEFSRIFTVQHRNLFQDSNIPKSYLTQIRGFSWHNNKIKRIRSGYYIINNFQDSNKRKRTESKTMGYLPRVLFFNVLELGKNCKSSNIKRWSIRINGCLTPSFLTFALDSRKDVIIARWRNESYIAFPHIYNDAQEL